MQGSSEPAKEAKKEKKWKANKKRKIKHIRQVIVCKCYLIRNFYPIARGDPKGSFMALEKPCKRPGPGATATALRRHISSIKKLQAARNQNNQLIFTGPCHYY